MAWAKALVRSGIAYTMESNSDIAAVIGEYQTNRDVNDIQTYIDGLQKVTAKDIQRVARQYADPERYVLAVVKPAEVK